jgi:hypothetical protein
MFRGRLSFANVVSVISLVFALGLGGAWAATELEKNQVKSKHIGAGQVKNSDLGNQSVTSPKVADGSLLDDDFAAGQLPQGARGPEGAQGPQGVEGPPGSPGQITAAAEGASGRATSTGVSRARNVTSFRSPSIGVYCVDPVPGIDIANAVVLATPDSGTGDTDQSADTHVVLEWDIVVDDCSANEIELNSYVFDGDGTDNTVNPPNDPSGDNLFADDVSFSFWIR